MTSLPCMRMWHGDPYHYTNSTAVLAASIMEPLKMQFKMVLLKDLKLTLIMVMSNFAKLVQLENQQPNRFQRNHSPVQLISERVHWDLWGPASVKNLVGKSYAAVRKNDTTCMVRPYFLAKKSETFSHYKEDEAWILSHGGKATSYAHFDCEIGRAHV